MNPQRLRVSLKQRWIYTVILVLAQVAVSFGDEIVPIGKILANAASFADHLATFRGTVVNLDRLPGPPVLLKNCWLRNRYKAVIEDETGSIDAIVCDWPLDEKGSVAQGDRVVIRANITVIHGEGFKSDVLATTVRMERAIEINQ
jgi:hypothetical protein